MTPPEDRVSTRLADELRVALARRGRTAVSVGIEAGISHSSVYNILKLGRVPTMEHAEAIAEVLDWVPIVTITRELRTKRCPVCRKKFVDRNRSNTSTTCSSKCSHTHYYRTVVVPQERHRRGTTIERLKGELAVSNRHLTMLQDAIHATCMECSERTMICRIPSCELRPVSPAVLPERSVA